MTLDPAKTVLVLRHDGREVGRIAATVPNAKEYIDTLARHYGGVDIEAVEDPDYAFVSRMLSTP